MSFVYMRSDGILVDLEGKPLEFEDPCKTQAEMETLKDLLYDVYQVAQSNQFFFGVCNTIVQQPWWEKKKKQREAQERSKKLEKILEQHNHTIANLRAESAQIEEELRVLKQGMQES